MLSDLLIHERTLTQLNNFLSSPSHGLALTAPAGSGKKALALSVAASLIGLDSVEKLQNYPYFTLVDPDANTITIDEIRSLQRLLNLKTPETSQPIRRVICVINAGRMRTEAQNAFLKSLEEPPTDTCIIFTTEGGNDLLPTIYSRMQRIDVQPISEQQASEYYSQKGQKSAEIDRNYALSQGQAGLLSSLLGDEEHPLKDQVEEAKKLLSRPAAERLLEVDELSKDKVYATQMVGALKRITHAALMTASKANNHAAVKRWQNGLKLTTEASKALLQNANTKLVLDHLLLNL